MTNEELEGELRRLVGRLTEEPQAGELQELAWGVLAATFGALLLEDRSVLSGMLEAGALGGVMALDRAKKLDAARRAKEN